MKVMISLILLVLISACDCKEAPQQEKPIEYSGE